MLDGLRDQRKQGNTFRKQEAKKIIILYTTTITIINIITTVQNRTRICQIRGCGTQSDLSRRRHYFAITVRVAWSEGPLEIHSELLTKSNDTVIMITAVNSGRRKEQSVINLRGFMILPYSTTQQSAVNPSQTDAWSDYSNSNSRFITQCQVS